MYLPRTQQRIVPRLSAGVNVFPGSIVEDGFLLYGIEAGAQVRLAKRLSVFAVINPEIFTGRLIVPDGIGGNPALLSFRTGLSWEVR
ncbi:MAG: hypothetical protein AAF399_11410 [Bacteroidota bacterium]